MNWKKYLFILSLFLTTSLSAQDFAAVDKYALKAPRDISKNLIQLNTYLVKDYETDLEKIRSFYIWL